MHKCNNKYYNFSSFGFLRKKKIQLVDFLQFKPRKDQLLKKQIIVKDKNKNNLL